MVKNKDAALDTIFAALSDPTRRKVLASLSDGTFSVTELAQPHDMSLPGFMKHLRILEDAGLIERLKEGRVVRCTLSAEPMQEAAVWLSRYHKFWTERLDSLARYLYHQEELTPWQTARPRSARRSPLPAATTPRPKRFGARGPTRKR